jgi:hypothetical protein
MSVVPLQIVTPVNGQEFAGSGSVHMTGTVGSPGPAGLFFKWYSSLSADPLNTTLDFTAPLKTGSHILTFTAKDVAGESAAALQSVQRAGMAGGPPIAQTPCIIHVFLANLVIPSVNGAALSKASSTLAAEAPFAWDKPDYQAVNRLRYRWRFTPFGAPSGRPSADLVPTPDQLTFRPIQQGDPAGTTPQILYTGPLPAALATGNYSLTLRVEDAQNASTGHEASLNVVVNP